MWRQVDCIATWPLGDVLPPDLHIQLQEVVHNRRQQPLPDGGACSAARQYLRMLNVAGLSAAPDIY